VHGQPELVRGGDRGGQLVERPDSPAGAAVRLLEHDDTRGLEPVCGGDRLADLVGGDPPRIPGQRAGDQARVNGGTACLEDQDVRALFGDQLPARPREDAQSDLVGHRRRRQEEGTLLPQELGRPPLELVDRRVLLLLLVTDLGLSHRRQHCRGRFRRRVGTEVDHGRQPSERNRTSERPCPHPCPHPGWGLNPLPLRATLARNPARVSADCVPKRATTAWSGTGYRDGRGS
jgi:hypothetical protein